MQRDEACVGAPARELVQGSQHEARLTLDHRQHRGDQWVPVELLSDPTRRRRVLVRLPDGCVVLRRARDVRPTAT